MATANPKISAYVPQVVYDRFKEFKEEHKLSFSQAAIKVFADYFGVDLSTNSIQQNTGTLLSRLLELEQIVSDLKQSYVYLSTKLESSDELHNPELPIASVIQDGSILHNPDSSIDYIPNDALLNGSQGSLLNPENPNSHILNSNDGTTEVSPKMELPRLEPNSYKLLIRLPWI
nr:ORF [Nostoc sp.]